jgi:hypothetical protein
MPRDREEKGNRGLLIALGAAGAALVVALAVTSLMPKPLPAPPAPPPPPAVRPATTTLRFTEQFYKAQIDEDAKKLGVEAISLADIGVPLDHFVELDTPRILDPGKSIETKHLKIAASVAKEWSTGSGGQGFRYEHVMLTITNLTGRPLAYRVETAIDQVERCRSKGALAHNAIALEGNGSVQRTECLWHRGSKLFVKRVEAFELTPLGYHYVSRLGAEQIGLDPRTAAGHTPPKGALCAYVPWREMEASGATWADVMDYYARHNCDEYAFYAGYKKRVEPGPLPAHEGTKAGEPPKGAGTESATQ